MHTIPLFIALIILVIGALARPTQVEEPANTLGETVQQPTPQKDANLPSTPIRSPTPTPSPTQKDANLPLPSPLDTFHYVPSTVKSSDEDSLILESGDHPDAITDWYKEKIKAAGMNAKSFVMTKTNGNVKNVLVGANGSSEVRVEIIQKAGDSTTQIVVAIQTS